ncbi:hypothetical protein [Arabidopsis thaliana]|uniref:Uncharacterized protein AT4g32590 n=1 Tax=Arabidopsis thaliana TaxID=3702 RepID=O65540_ARATH|nr:hypothetical protein [Arabidopsis thaliana]CAB79976.1 hypothetical protein [Arabidopsis thaliana]
MASLGFNLGFTFSNAQIQQHRKVSGGGRARVISCNSSSSSSSQASSPQGISAVTPLEIELEFFGPKPGSDGSYPVDKAKAVSGDKLLRSIMQDNKIELYAAYILDGRDLLNERTDTENRYLKKASYLITPLYIIVRFTSFSLLVFGMGMCTNKMNEMLSIVSG